MSSITLWAWLCVSLCTPAILVPASGVVGAPACLAEDLEKEILDGHMLSSSGEVLEGRFSIDWKDPQSPRIRKFRSAKAKSGPIQKDVVLIVDGDGKTRFPKSVGEKDAGSYRALATGACGTDAGCAADLLARCAGELAEEAPSLATSLYGDALVAVPAHSGALEAIDALPRDARLRIIRRALDANPQAETLGSRVREMFPRGVTPKKGFLPLEWLDLGLAMERLEVRLVLDPEAKTPGLIPAERKLGTYRHSKVWGRSDLIGFRSHNLFLVTSLRDARAIHDCLLRGELVCGILERLFEKVEHRRSEDETAAGHDMLIVFLFESRAEYLQLGENLRTRGMSTRHAFTAGFFSAHDRISRFFLPDRGDRYLGLRNTLAHEITHQWIFERCPGFTNEEAIAAVLEGRTLLPGAWIVEGFASMMEELAYDDAAGTYEAMNPKADRLDTIANSSEDQLLDWGRLYELNYASVEQLNPRPYQPELLIPISWLEGRMRIMSELALFYAQSAVTCHYLFTNEEGALREKLLQFLVAYYSGDEAGVGFEAVFGMEEMELGRRVWKHSQEWGPKAAELREN
jgi:hypothetical protein